MTQAPEPRLTKIEAMPPTSLVLHWADFSRDVVDLAGWMSRPGPDLFKALSDPEIFKTAIVTDYGLAVCWNDDDDLAIDSTHLMRLAELQRPFTHEDAIQCQVKIGLSNNEMADALGIGLSTWNSYKVKGARIAFPIALACRTLASDVTFYEARFKPRTSGRPAKRHMTGKILKQTVQS